MSQSKSLTTSIFLTTGLFFIGHFAVLLAIFLIHRVNAVYLLWYGVASFLMHGLVLLVLLKSRRDFYLLESREPLEKVNLANKLTLFRLTSLPSLLALLIAGRVYPLTVYLVVYTVLAFLSDLLDGYVSRKTHQTTRIGQYLDSMSDYALLIAIAIAFAQFGLASLWFFALVLIRFLLQWLMAGILFVAYKGKLESKSSFLGKVSVALTMVVFAAYLLKLFKWFDVLTPYVFVLELLCSAALAVSLVEKIVVFVKDFKASKAAGTSQATDSDPQATPPKPQT